MRDLAKMTVADSFEARIEKEILPLLNRARMDDNYHTIQLLADLSDTFTQYQVQLLNILVNVTNEATPGLGDELIDNYLNLFTAEVRPQHENKNPT